MWGWGFNNRGQLGSGVPLFDNPLNPPEQARPDRPADSTVPNAETSRTGSRASRKRSPASRRRSPAVQEWNGWEREQGPELDRALGTAEVIGYR